jgi:hypothetical protein
MSPASKKVVKNTLEGLEMIYKLQQSQSPEFYKEEIEEMILLLISANFALLDRMKMFENSFIIPTTNN